MSDHLSPIKQALLKIRELQSEVTQLRGEDNEPVAIVGYGFRWPGGVKNEQAYWELLEAGRDAIEEIPSERWSAQEWYDEDPDAPGKMNTKWGGFLNGLEEVDASFFGFSPEEAPLVDPQERLLMEATWEALEKGGFKAPELMKSRTGVYLGLGGNEYGLRAFSDINNISPYAGLTASPSGMVGRVSYWLGLQGPNMPIDTACSSALVAMHLASQALRNGECSLALAGGVNVILSPVGHVFFTKLRAMSPTGRCHTFSEEADGFVRSEGCGVVVLEKLSDALKNKRRILAVIKGTAINQDGRSNGPTAPNGPAQEAVIEEALRRAGVEPNTVEYLECHGTGTKLGDPMEVEAAAAVYGRERDKEQPLWMGSVKSNIGHTEAAAGAAGVIKAVLALKHELIPKSLHAQKLNPHIMWSELPIKVATEAKPWPRGNKPRRVGVSSFGISGTNAHVVMEEAPLQEEEGSAPERDAEIICISGKVEGAVNGNAEKLRKHLQENPGLKLGDVAYSLLKTRTAHEERACVVVNNREELLEKLEGIAKGETPEGVVRGRTNGDGVKLGYIFSGQGTQELGMGREAYEEWPEFRKGFDEACEELDKQLSRPLKEVVWGKEGSEEAKLVNETEFVQAGLFVLEWGLWRQFEAWGVRPRCVSGHSIGEIVAATAAGVFSLKDAAKLVGARGRLMQKLPKGGVMEAVEASEEEARAAMKEEEKVSLASFNGPRSVVVSGEAGAVERVVGRLKAKGLKAKRLKVSHAFHSPLMRPILREFEEVAKGIEYQLPKIKLISNVTGKVAGEEVTKPGYWVRHVEEGVRFGEGVKTLREDGVNTFLELGPKATLLGLVPLNLKEGDEVSLVAGLGGRAEKEKEGRRLLRALGGLHCVGLTIDEVKLFPKGGKRVELPAYAWQKQRYWVEAKKAHSDDERKGHLLGDTDTRIAASRVEDDWIESLKGMSEEKRQEAIEELVRSEAAKIVGLLGAAAVPLQAPLKSLGLDSLMAVELRNVLAKKVGVSLPSTLALEHPTASDVARFVLERIGKQRNVPEDLGRGIRAVDLEVTNEPRTYIRQATWSDVVAEMIGAMFKLHGSGMLHLGVLPEIFPKAIYPKWIQTQVVSSTREADVKVDVLFSLVDMGILTPIPHPKLSAYWRKSATWSDPKLLNGPSAVDRKVEVLIGSTRFDITRIRLGVLFSLTGEISHCVVEEVFSSSNESVGQSVTALMKATVAVIAAETQQYPQTVYTNLDYSDIEEITIFEDIPESVCLQVRKRIKGPNNSVNEAGSSSCWDVDAFAISGVLCARLSGVSLRKCPVDPSLEGYFSFLRDEKIRVIMDSAEETDPACRSGGFESCVVKSGGLGLEFLRWGTGSKALLLIPGAVADARGYAVLAESISADYTVYGVNIAPAGRTTLEPADLILVVEAIMRGMMKLVPQRSYDVFGYSSGAAPAAWLAARCPQYVHSLLLYGPYLRNNYLPVKELTMLSGEEQLEIVADQITKEWNAKAPQLRKNAQELMKLASSGMTAESRMLGNQAFVTAQRVSGKVFQGIQCPTRIVGGTDDFTVEVSWLVALAPLLSNARIELIANEGHYILFSNPKLLGKVINDHLLNVQALRL